MAWVAECGACGARFSTPIGEARHRHNFPILCKRNKRFKAWDTRRQMGHVADVLQLYADIAEFALPKFDWGKSALDAKAIEALSKLPNDTPVRKLIERLRRGEL